MLADTNDPVIKLMDQMLATEIPNNMSNMEGRLRIAAVNLLTLECAIRETLQQGNEYNIVAVLNAIYNTAVWMVQDLELYPQ